MIKRVLNLWLFVVSYYWGFIHPKMGNMVEDLMREQDGSIKLIRHDAEEEQWSAIIRCFKCADGKNVIPINNQLCNGCKMEKAKGKGFITSIFLWINGATSQGCKIGPIFRNCKTARALWLNLSNANEQLDKVYRVSESSIKAWKRSTGTTRDPRKNPCSHDALINLYKVCFLLGLYHKDDIERFFEDVACIKAFSGLVNNGFFELWAEHMVLNIKKEESGKKSEDELKAEERARNWLTISLDRASINWTDYQEQNPESKSVNSVAKPKSKEDAVRDIDDDDDVVSLRSSSENENVSDNEFEKLINARKIDAKSASELVACYREKVFRKFNDLPENNKVSFKNKHVISRILIDRETSSATMDNFKATMIDDLREIRASIHFPTAAILNRIMTDTANAMQIRRMLILLIFAKHYYHVEKETPVERKKNYLKFRDECNKQLDSISYKKLDFRDGFDVLILFCCSAEIPMEALHKRLKTL